MTVPVPDLKPHVPPLAPNTECCACCDGITAETPQGIYDMVMWASERGYPVIITENGASDPSDPAVASRYLATHVGWLARAAADGAKVRGYFYWTLVDNYEWNHGMQMRFGLFGLEGAQKVRTARPAVDIFRQLADARGLTDELAMRYPLPTGSVGNP